MKPPLAFRLRRRYGCCWQSHYPGRRELSRAWGVIRLLALLVLLYGIVGRLDYEAELTTELIKLEAQRQEADSRLVACLNGRSPGYYHITPKGHRIQTMCDPAWEVDLGPEEKL